MTQNTITTTVTFEDLIAQYDDELADLRDAYEDVVAKAESDHGDDSSEWPEEVQQQAAVYDESGKQIQRRQHVLESLRDEYGGGEFELKMLSGSELMDIETQLRMEANRKDAAVDAMQARRQQLVVDAATVSAPEWVPRDDDASPAPSECPNPLALALHEQAESLNTAGATDFRAPGFAEGERSAASASSARPTTAESPSSDLRPSDDDTPTRGDSS